MLPCLFKTVTGCDCPGCGIQRSFLELLQGNFAESLKLFPALIPLIVLLLFLILHLRYKFKYGAKLLVVQYIFTTSVLLVNYIFKFI